MTSRKRVIWLILFLCIGFTLISYRLVYIQLVEYDKYRRMAIENHCRRIVLPAHRGMIYDCNHQCLAETQTMYAVHLDGGNVLNPVSYTHLTLPTIYSV